MQQKIFTNKGRLKKNIYSKIKKIEKKEQEIKNLFVIYTFNNKKTSKNPY